MLPRLNIIVAVDEKNGIGKDGKIPWRNPEDLKFFKYMTIGDGNNALIMGRKTYESIPKKLDRRKIVILSRTLEDEYEGNSVYSSLLSALKRLGKENYENIYICGGEQLYKQVIEDYLYLCDDIYVTKNLGDYDSDTFFPFDKIKDFNYVCSFQENRFTYFPEIKHDEEQYLNLLRKIKDEGEERPDRTGVGTRSIFGARMEFDISERIPILTTKKVFYNMVIKELLFFISGKTDSNILSDDGVKIWKGNSSKEFLEKRGLNYKEGDIGAIYGFQFRHWNAEYKGCDADYTGKGIDQLQNLIKGIREDPYSRRHLLSTWNVGQLDEMVLAPCHVLCQFYVSKDRYLDCQLYQRSGDMFLGVPFNIACYSIFTRMISHITGLKARKFIHIIGDSHIYNNHIEQVEKQLKRTPMPFPKLYLNQDVKEIDDFTFPDFLIDEYNCWPGIKAQMAI